MDHNMLFATALGLSSPWHIAKVEFKDEESRRELHLTIEHDKGVKFSLDGEPCSVYDHQNRTWRHLNFFEHECYLHASVPRVKDKGGKVRLVEVPWANSNSSFTLLFEAYTALLVKSGMSVTAAGNYVDESYKIVHRIIKSLVMEAITEQPLEDVKELAIDETSTKKGHNYFTILSDRERKIVVGVSEGKSKESVKSASEEMIIRGVDISKVRNITMDMSPSYIGAAREYFGQAEIIFDRYHISAQLNKVVDEIRRKEQREYHELTKSRYLWLKNSNKLTEKDRAKVDYLAETYPNIGTAYRLKEILKEVFDEAVNNHTLKPIKEWMKAALKTDLKPLHGFVKMLKRHWYGIKTYFKKQVTNAYAERVNLKIQEIKRIAKGYRNQSNYKMMIYFHLGGLDMKLPTSKG
jgi:transposase